MHSLAWQLYTGIVTNLKSVISYYSSIQQGVGTHPCSVTIYRLLHRGVGIYCLQRQYTPAVHGHSLHTISPTIYYSIALHRISKSNRRGHCSDGSANDQVIHMVIDYVAFPCVDDVDIPFAMIRLVLVVVCRWRLCLRGSPTANGSSSSNVVVHEMGRCTSGRAMIALYLRALTHTSPSTRRVVHTSDLDVSRAMGSRGILSCHSRRQFSAEVGSVIDRWSLYHQLTR